jgi:hypothetical protein
VYFRVFFFWNVLTVCGGSDTGHCLFLWNGSREEMEPPQYALARSLQKDPSQPLQDKNALVCAVSRAIQWTARKETKARAMRALRVYMTEYSDDEIKHVCRVVKTTVRVHLNIESAIVLALAAGHAYVLEMQEATVMDVLEAYRFV